jgi:hypothetical protein
MVRLAEVAGTGNTIETYKALRSGGNWTSRDGVYGSFEELEANQKTFQAGIKPDLLKRPINTHPRQDLVWVQIGPGSEFVKWFDRHAERDWDLLANWYDFSGLDLSLGDITVAQRGTKFTAVSALLKHHPELFEPYERILFLDDDQSFAFGDINRLFTLSRDHKLSLFQPALTERSYCVWPIIKRSSTEPVRLSNTVEIMMPGMTVSLLNTLAPLFDQTISGFGLDFAMGAEARKLGLQTGIIYDVRADHLSPISESAGAYYTYMRANGIHPKLELWRLLQKRNLEREICLLD